MKTKEQRYDYRKERSRLKLARNTERPRLAVHKTSRHLYAQLVDDSQGKTLAFVTSLSKEFKGQGSTKNLEAAKKLGGLLAKKAIAAGVKKVRFDRGGHLYHGKIKALADAAREAGLEF